MKKLEENIGYEFKNKELLKKALTHTSYAYEHHVESNEKLEFLGDSILEFVSSIYLFKNFENLKDEIKIASQNVGQKDYKTVLQEKLQVHGVVKIEYKIIRQTGPDHDKTFEALVECNKKELARGIGKSKKLAEMEAARKALENYNKSK